MSTFNLRSLGVLGTRATTQVLDNLPPQECQVGRGLFFDMPYDHTRQAGNEGDVVKHVVLAHLIELEARRQEDFVYAEAHAGRAEYALTTGGKWKDGVGKLFAQPAVQAQCVAISSAASSLSGLDALNPFIGLYLRPRPPHGCGPGKAYLGSNGLAFRLLQEGGRRFRIHLWDIEGAVYDDLRRHYEVSLNREVFLNQGDGYDGVQTLRDQANLTLIDPADLEPKHVLACLQSLQAGGRPFLCWTPRLGTNAGNESRDTREIRELALAAGYGVHLARWSNWRTRIVGCQLTVPIALSTAVETAVDQVRKVMKWEFDD